MDKNKLLLNRLIAYGSSEAYPFHMPGHKRMIDNFPNSFSIDITEIDGFDNLHHPEGILKESMEWAASVYGSDKTWYLVNGSSCGILSAICSSVKSGGRILMSRNCHKSAYHGVILNRLKTAYIYPQIISELGIQGGISPEDVEKNLQKYPDTEAVLIVSPTYDGVVSDIERIAEIVHGRKIPLIVDEAHGAHFSFGCQSYFPKSALDCGADLVIQSLHKTLPSLTQTAVLHGKDRYVDLERLEYYLQMFQSSSPSYVFMASMERCIFEMEKSGKERMHAFGERIRRMRDKLSEMKNFQLLDRSVCGQYEVFDVDESKLVVSVRGCMRRDEKENGVTADGVWLADQLRKNYQLEMEMSGADYVVAILTCFDTEDGIKRLEKALLELDSICYGGKSDPVYSDPMCWNYPCHVMTLSDAFHNRWEEMPLEQCADRISAEFIYLYPPGIPIVAPGEMVTDAIINRVLYYKKMNLPVQGMADQKANMLRVVR